MNLYKHLRLQHKLPLAGEILLPVPILVLAQWMAIFKFQIYSNVYYFNFMAFDMAVVAGGSLFIDKVGTQDFRKKKDLLISFSSTTSYTALFSCTTFSRINFFLK